MCDKYAVRTMFFPQKRFSSFQADERKKKHDKNNNYVNKEKSKPLLIMTETGSTVLWWQRTGPLSTCAKHDPIQLS